RDALRAQRENAEASRDAVSAVNLDEEAADLLRFQQAYQAAAQLIQVTNETFNALLEAVG
ncbi:MAG: flagellar basal body rod C-terminal domain-containing protein, partial [Gammaproteobacteria bacterium]